VVEVSLRADGTPRVHRVVCAVDAGQVVNPAIVRQQMRGAIVFGLSAALHGEITLAGGAVQQANFNDYPVLRMDEAPVIDVHMVPSTEAPGGVGEPGTPPLAPALANALFALTGRRVRRLPFKREDFTQTRDERRASNTP
jgi:isoquinoline 1-oxidoreductase beta subunit